MVNQQDISVDHIILDVFEEQEDTFFFPVESQREARAFVKVLGFLHVSQRYGNVMISGLGFTKCTRHVWQIFKNVQQRALTSLDKMSRTINVKPGGPDQLHPQCSHKKVLVCNAHSDLCFPCSTKMNFLHSFHRLCTGRVSHMKQSTRR